MNGAFRRGLVVALWLGVSLVQADPHHHAGGPRDGRYVGVAVFDSLGWKIPCELDLSVVQDGADAQYERRRAFLKCLPGGYASREYLAQYYDTVPYSFEKQTLQLLDSRNDLKASLLAKGDTLTGDLRSVLGRVAGRLTLQLMTADDEEPDPEEPGQEDPATAAFGDGGSPLPFFGALGGDWTGKCDSEPWILRVQSAKGVGALDLEMGAALTMYSDPCSVDGKANWCWVSGFNRSQWNPFQQSGNNLRFIGPRETLACRIGAEDASCQRMQARKVDTCQFHRTPLTKPSAVLYHRQDHVAVSPAQREPLPDVPVPGDLAGHFWGLLHHELLDRYQWVEFSVESFFDTDTPHRGNEILKVSADATLYFGARAQGDRVVARFDARPYLNTFPDFTFSSGGDAMLRVVDWRRGYLRGVWYSKAFGRVGTVELVRTETQPEGRDVKWIPALSGSYRSKRFGLQLQALPAAVGNLWGLLDVQGSSISFAEGGVAGPSIQRGEYDWFTGGVALNTDFFPITGTVADDGLHLSWPINPAAGGFLPMPPVVDIFEPANGGKAHE